MSRGGRDDHPHPDGCDFRNRSKRGCGERAEQSHDAEGRGNSHGDSHGTSQPEHRNRRAARRHSGCRAEDGGAHHRLPPEERRLQEGRRPDERQRGRGEEFPQDETAHHRHRAPGRPVADVSGRGGASRRPRPAREGTSHGYTLIELMFAAGIIAVLGAAAIPQLTAGVERSRTVGAARYLASRLALARAHAVARSANVALLLTATDGTFVVGTYADGNGDGVRTRDITAGIDTAVGVPVRLSTRFPHVVLLLNDPTVTSTFDTS